MKRRPPRSTRTDTHVPCATHCRSPFARREAAPTIMGKRDALMKDMGLWDEGDWIAVIAVVVLGIFLSIGALIAGSKKPEFAGHPKGQIGRASCRERVCQYV